MRVSEAAIEQVLTKHRGVSVSAKWPGSPDPSNWRNIRRICSCGERIPDGPRPRRRRGQWAPLGGWPFDEPHRAHVAAAIVAAMEPTP